jgi:nucleotide-binding universal stress UspA family protein
MELSIKMISDSHPTRYLTLDKLVVNRQLAQRLPSNLALRYHALPVAKDNGHITVAMANPNDQRARKVIAAALGAELFVVECNPTAIDELLTEIWPEESDHVLRLLVYHQASPIADQVQTYAQYLRDLLNGQLNYCQPDDSTDTKIDDLLEAASCGQDLVIFGEPDQSLIKRLLSGPKGCQAAERVPTSVLITRRPRWPLKNILLMTRGQETSTAAVDWAVRLAEPSNAAVTVLAVLPAAPTVYSQTLSKYGLAYWLTTDTPLGCQLRQIAQQLTNWEIEGELRFRQGSPENQIRRELAEHKFDLIVTTADPVDWWQRRLLGQFVNQLLHWVDRPVLIAKPKIA